MKYILRKLTSVTLNLLAGALLMTGPGNAHAGITHASPAKTATPAARETGVLVLAHGGKYKSWDDAVLRAAEPLKKQYPVEVAFGMADPTSMQAGIDKLEAQGVTRIVVVQLFVSSFSPIIRQNEYLLGLRDELADPPMMHHHHSSHGSMHDAHHGMHGAHTMDIKPLRIKAEIILTKPLDDHPLVTDILLDRIHQLSTKPANETVFLVAHGPNDEEDNEGWIRTMNSLAAQIREKQSAEGAAFREIHCLTVRDDAEPAIYEQAKQELRAKVSRASEEGVAIVIPLLLSQGGVEERYLKRLEGLTYEWSGETLLPHENISRFVQTSVEETLNAN